MQHDEKTDRVVVEDTPVVPARAGKSCPRRCSSLCCMWRMILRLGLIYVLYAAFFRCSPRPFSFTYDADDKLLVCRELASAQQHVMPVVHEYAQKAHQTLHPYAGKYMDGAHKLWTDAQPLIHSSAQRSHQVFMTHVKPGVHELYKQALTWSKPYQKSAHTYYKKHLRRHVQQLHKRSAPYFKTYQRDVHPHIMSAVQFSRHAFEVSTQFYEDELHPRIKKAIYDGYMFLRHTVWPTVHHHYVTIAHPHLRDLHQRGSAFVGDVIDRSGIKERSSEVYDHVVQNAKEMYDQTVRG